MYKLDNINHDSSPSYRRKLLTRISQTTDTAQRPLQGSEDAEAEPAPGPDDPQPLSEEEEQEKAALMEGGFKEWSRRDFSAFVRACEKVRRPCVITSGLLCRMTGRVCSLNVPEIEDGKG